MERIAIRIEDPKGNQLPTTQHNGKCYVAGKQNVQYQIRLQNKTNKRLLAILTVDGRNVYTGDPGGTDYAGYVLTPYETLIVKGYRISEKQVAVFRFSKKAYSYAAKQEAPQNVGIIGVAIFEEQHLVYPSTPPWDIPIYPLAPYSPYNPMEPYISWCLSCEPRVTTISSNTTTVCSAPYNNIIETSLSLGTAFGKTITSPLDPKDFQQLSNTPCEIWTIYYDTMKSLQKQGIMERNPLRPETEKPKAFPGQPYWNPDRYCTIL